MTPKPSGLPQATPRGLTDLTPQEREGLSTADTDPTLLARKDALIWKQRAEAAEAERDRLAGRVAELERKRD